MADGFRIPTLVWIGNMGAHVAPVASEGFFGPFPTFNSNMGATPEIPPVVADNPWFAGFVRRNVNRMR